MMHVANRTSHAIDARFSSDFTMCFSRRAANRRPMELVAQHGGARRWPSLCCASSTFTCCCGGAKATCLDVGETLLCRLTLRERVGS